MELGRVGVWTRELRTGDEGARRDAAAQLEELGYGALWFPGGHGDDSMDCARIVLDATRRVTVATGITNIWTEPADEVAAKHAELAARYDHRFLLGVGISHRAPMDRIKEGMYDKPFSAMVAYLDELDAAPEPPPGDERVIAALGPRMLRLSAERAAGTHPYLSVPDHTRDAREAVGPDKHVAPEQGIVLETDPVRARELARGFVERYLTLPNYFRQWLRYGFTEDDLRDGGSDRLVDALIAWGDEETIAARVQEHLDAGADHVCVQFIHDLDGLPTEQWRRMAEVLPRCPAPSSSSTSSATTSPAGRYPLVEPEAAARRGTPRARPLPRRRRAGRAPPARVGRARRDVHAAGHGRASRSTTRSRPADGEPVIEKAQPNGFLGTPLEEQLRDAGVDELVVAGMMSSMCVDATVRARRPSAGSPSPSSTTRAQRRTSSSAASAIPGATVHGAFMAALGDGYATLASSREVAGA